MWIKVIFWCKEATCPLSPIIATSSNSERIILTDDKGQSRGAHMAIGPRKTKHTDVLDRIFGSGLSTNCLGLYSASVAVLHL